MAKYEFWKRPDGDWHWHLKGSNGRILASSEGYRRKAGCLAGIAAHRRAAQTAKAVECAR